MLTVKYKKHPKPIDGIDYFSEEELNKEENSKNEETADESNVTEIKEGNDEQKTL